MPGELAATPDGRAWVIKALHPSDPITNSRGMPDPSSCPNVVLSYYNVYRLSGDPADATWGFDLTIIPNMLIPAFAQTYHPNGLLAAQSNFLNGSFTPPGVVAPTYTQLLAQFATMGIEAHRLIGMGVTAYQDGPALANQGTLTAAQWEVARKKFYVAPRPGLAAPASTGLHRIAKYEQGDFAFYDSSQHMPNAYFGESKDGCYLPLRLSDSCQKWVTDADMEYQTSAAINLYNGLDLTDTEPARAPPYPAVISAFTPAYAPGNLAGNLVYRPLNSIWGGISARNLSIQTSFAFYVRMSIECRVQPSSVLAPQQTMSPPYDPIALASYFRISRELKDAYPADYNDLGKLWSVIKSAAKVVGPVLSAIPGPVGLIGSAVASGIGAVDSLVSASRGKNGKTAPRDRPAAAATERAQRRADASSVGAPTRQPQQRKRNKQRKAGKK